MLIFWRFFTCIVWILWLSLYTSLLSVFWVIISWLVMKKNTFLVIVSKVDQSKVLTKFRLIAICNVTYKLVTKIVVNLNNIIPPRQSIIIIAQEMVHAMKRVKENKMFMLIKIYLEKVYDILPWKFVTQCF